MVRRDFQGERSKVSAVQGFLGTSQLSRKGFVTQGHSGTQHRLSSRNPEANTIVNPQRKPGSVELNHFIESF